MPPKRTVEDQPDHWLFKLITYTILCIILTVYVMFLSAIGLIILKIMSDFFKIICEILKIKL